MVLLILLFIVFAIMGFSVQSTLRRKFKAYTEVPIEAGLTGKEVAEKMLRDNFITDVQVVSVPGRLTDHYNPKDKTVNLSPDVFNGRSVAAAAVAAHECGHAVQHATSYTWLTMRSRMVPIVNISSQLMNILFFMLIIGGVAYGANYMTLAYILIGAQAAITAFALVTLPVEYDASNRALAWLESARITSPETQEKAKDALKWAARTYLVSALAAITTLLYYVMLFAGGRD
ncbi:zinc metallopeptidase [Phaeocystidibacter luteus]|uniref:Zinc metallopeptidase n=1 Tax=Phaeocystidibacter luteus TaxID=911197 RepID=A0A6N6RKF3_9FLAO|nr:zinc metallopeptidase [Phaeocystidibacter luteus]KAB2810036.1 zinc metallopeptidase [Phaeocystidibacter luteus]